MADLPAPRVSDDAVVTVACREFVELVTEYVEGALPEPLERAIAAHLELCEPCLLYLEQMRSTAAALRELPAPTLPGPARQRLLDVFASVHSPGAQDGDGSSTHRTGRPGSGS
jgi:anti-sigma factor RsiW